MKKRRTLYLTEASLVAAMYVALTWISNAFGLASGAIQIRISEALCVLPFFMGSAVPGLFVGCIISNLTMGSVIFDTVFGSLATLVGAYVGSKMKCKYLVPLPTVIANTVVVPVVVLFFYTEVQSWGVYWFTVGTVFAGEMISAYLLGLILLAALDRKKGIFVKKR